MTYTRFIILGQERTGSTLLQMLLYSDDSVISRGEIFNPRESVRREDGRGRYLASGDDPIAYLDNHIYGVYPESVRAVGFRLFYTHARHDAWRGVWNYLVQTQVRVIHLKRRNLLDRYLSQALAQRSDQWIMERAKDKYSVAEPIMLDPVDCLKSFHKTVWFYDQANDFFCDNPLLEVIYEDLAVDSAQTCREVQDFLGLEPKPLSTKMVKQQRKPKPEMISNYGELKEVVQRYIATNNQADPSWLEFFDDESLL